MKTIHETRPWGSETWLTHNEPSTVKLLYVKKGEKLSLQYHMKRQEFWKVISGNPEVIIGQETTRGNPGDEFEVPVTIQHRISAPENDVVILEITTGEHDEGDEVRVEDEYHRDS